MTTPPTPPSHTNMLLLRQVALNQVAGVSDSVSIGSRPYVHNISSQVPSKDPKIATAVQPRLCSITLAELNNVFASTMFDICIFIRSDVFRLERARYVVRLEAT